MTEIKISDEAVEIATKVLHPGLYEEDGLLHPMLANSGRWDARRKVREALESAVPHLQVQAECSCPQMDPAWLGAIADESDPPRDPDCPLHAPAPVQVDREAIEREIRRATTAMLCNSDIPGWTMQEEVSKAATAVLALLSPEETK